MNSLTSFTSPVTSLVFFIFLISPVVHSYDEYECEDSGNYTIGDAYQANLNILLSSLYTKVDDYGFFHGSQGQSPDAANAMVFCRGDVQLDTCRGCIQNATTDVLQLCPNQKEVILWDTLCVLKYSNDHTFGTIATSPGYHFGSSTNATSPSVFLGDLKTLLDDIRGTAVYSLHKVAAGNRTSANFQTIYAFMQCVPDLSQEDCSNSLLDAAREMGSCCSTSDGVKMYMPNCILFYNLGSFINEARIQELDSVPTPPLRPPA